MQDQQASYVLGMDYDGSKFNMHRGNTQVAILPSAARSTSIVSPTVINHNTKGVMITLNVTAASGKGGLTVKINGYDSLNVPFII